MPGHFGQGETVSHTQKVFNFKFDAILFTLCIYNFGVLLSLLLLLLVVVVYLSHKVRTGSKFLMSSSDDVGRQRQRQQRR